MNFKLQSSEKYSSPRVHTEDSVNFELATATTHENLAQQYRSRNSSVKFSHQPRSTRTPPPLPRAPLQSNLLFSNHGILFTTLPPENGIARERAKRIRSTRKSFYQKGPGGGAPCPRALLQLRGRLRGSIPRALAFKETGANCSGRGESQKELQARVNEGARGVSLLSTWELSRLKAE